MILNNLNIIGRIGKFSGGKRSPLCGSQSWEDYWATRKPSGLTLSLVAGGVKIDWTDNSSGAIQVEIWARSDNGESELLTTINAGITTFNDITDPVDLRYYKIRGLIIGHYSEFTEEESIALLGAEMVVGDWKLQSWWNGSTWDESWTADGITLSCDGTAGLISRDTFWLNTKTYRTEITITGTGTAIRPYAGLTPSAQYITAPGTYIEKYYQPTRSKFYIGSVTFNGTVTGLSIKEVLSPPRLAYIATTGDDTTGDGSVANPWKTLYKACESVTTPGSIIQVAAGSYVETQMCELAAGVSIRGVGDTSVITLAPVYYGLICVSASPQNGSQTISYLKFDGNSACTLGLYVKYRNWVKVSNCSVVNCINWGISFENQSDGAILDTHNEISNCYINNNGGVANIKARDQYMMRIFNNTIIQTTRAQGSNKDNVYLRYNKDLKFYNNKSYKPDNEGNGWNFHIESQGGLGGIEFYDNEFLGGGVGIDIAGTSNVKGDYAYSWWVHNNLFKMTAPLAWGLAGKGALGVTFEATNEDAIVEKNWFENLSYGVAFATVVWGGDHDTRIKIRYNVFKTIGWTDYKYVGIIHMNAYHANAYIRQIQIDNNLFLAGNTLGIVYFSGAGNIENIDIRNNIIKDVDDTGILYFRNDAGDYNTINLLKNIIFNNTNDDNYYDGGKVVPGVTEDTINSDPTFNSASDYHLKAGSPGIDAGIDVDAVTDYEEIDVDATPNIGIYETII